MGSVCILGGGVTGLAAAHYLAGVGEVLVLEGGPRLGGWLRSYRHPAGALMETGPRTLRVGGTAGANTLCLAQDLGLQEVMRPIHYSHPAATNRMIQVGGQLHTLPNSLTTALRKVAPFSEPLILSILRDLRAPKVTNSDESLYSFVRRRFGREVAEYIADPLARGVFAGNARDLSIKSLGASLHQWEQQSGGVIRGAITDAFKRNKKHDNCDQPIVKKAKREKWAVWSLEGGLDRLVDALRDDVVDKGVTIKLNSPVDELRLETDGRIGVRCGSTTVTPDHVISCLPSYQLAKICGNLNHDLQSLMNSIPFCDAAVVNLEYEGEDLISQPGFGYLVPSSEDSKVLGVIFDTCPFPQSNTTVLTVMMGGYWFQDLFGSRPSEEELLAIAAEEVHRVLSMPAHPVHHHVSVHRQCIPQYVVGHSETVTSARALLRALPLQLAGSSYDGVGINDAIMSAKSAVKNIL